MNRIFFNSHCHRKPASRQEFICRNAYHFLNERSLERLPYPVSVGVHPWHAADCSVDLISGMKRQLALPNVLAIGEAGLDKRKGPPLSIQLACWEKQFRMSQDEKVPLIVHCVKAWQEILPLVRSTGVPLMFHDFRGNRELFFLLNENPNIFFSFGKSLLSAGRITEVFRLIPDHKILLETDQSPIGIAGIHELACRIRGIRTEEFSVQLKKNGLRFFGEKALPFF